GRSAWGALHHPPAIQLRQRNQLLPARVSAARQALLPTYAIGLLWRLNSCVGCHSCASSRLHATGTDGALAYHSVLHHIRRKSARQPLGIAVVFPNLPDW